MQHLVDFSRLVFHKNIYVNDESSINTVWPKLNSSNSSRMRFTQLLACCGLLVLCLHGATVSIVTQIHCIFHLIVSTSLATFQNPRYTCSCKQCDHPTSYYTIIKYSHTFISNIKSHLVFKVRVKFVKSQKSPKKFKKVPWSPWIPLKFPEVFEFARRCMEFVENFNFC